MAGTIKHQWNGTVLTIESDSGVSSCDLKGAKGDDGPRGAQGAPGSTIVEDCQKLGGVAAENYALKTDTVENANKLGNVAAAQYVLKTDTVENANKLGNVAAESYALKTDTVENANNLGDVAAANYALKTDTIENANKLGNVAAESYALKTDTVENANKLGGFSLEEIMLKLYPVGAIYISAVSTSPASLFGGTWEILNDVFLLAAGSYANAGTFGGEAEHTLTVDELPNINGTINMHGAGTGGAAVSAVTGVFSPGATEAGYNTGENKTGAPSVSNVVFNVGGGAAHNNMPPYLAVYMWKRVA